MNADGARILLIAGNGFVGRAAALAFAGAGAMVSVLHTGSRPAPEHPRISDILAPRVPAPITRFPDAAIRAAQGAAAVIHVYAMGQPDAEAFVAAFDGRARRLVLISSCDVYRAYARFIRTEPGPPDPTPLTESSALRARRHPYRSRSANARELEYWYDKIDAETALTAAAASETTILRLAKVYGPDGDRELSTVYGYADHPDWRWTHIHVANLAAAIVRASLHPRAAGEVFNVGEAATPTMGERLAALPARPEARLIAGEYDFRQDIAVSSAKLRDQLGFEDVVDETEAMSALAHSIES